MRQGNRISTQTRPTKTAAAQTSSGACKGSAPLWTVRGSHVQRTTSWCVRTDSWRQLAVRWTVYLSGCRSMKTQCALASTSVQPCRADTAHIARLSNRIIRRETLRPPHHPACTCWRFNRSLGHDQRSTRPGCASSSSRRHTHRPHCASTSYPNNPCMWRVPRSLTRHTCDNDSSGKCFS